MKIYLAGSVPKGAEEEKQFVNWRVDYKKILEQFLDAEFIFPGVGDMDESDYLLIVGKDSRSIKYCDLVIVNAEEKLGVGTAHEMVIAKYFKKPVVVVLPKDSYHRKANLTFQGKYHVADWVHPFIHTFCDFIVESPTEIEKIKDKIFSILPKDITIIDKAVKHREDVAGNDPDGREQKVFL